MHLKQVMANGQALADWAGRAVRPAAAGVRWGRCCLHKGTARKGVIWGQLNRMHEYNVFELAGAWPCSVLSACSHLLTCSAGALQKQQREKLRAALAANDRVAHWLDTIRRQIEQGIEGADEKRVQLERVGRGHGSAVMRELRVLGVYGCEGWCAKPGSMHCEAAAAACRAWAQQRTHARACLKSRVLAVALGACVECMLKRLIRKEMTQSWGAGTLNCSGQLKALLKLCGSAKLET